MKIFFKNVRKYFVNILLGFDQFLNAIMLGDPDETISSRAGRVWPGTWWSNFIDWLMFWQTNHCYKAIEEDEGQRDILFPRRKV